MTDASPLERLLRRDRLVTLAGLALLCALAWLYLFAGAGLDADAHGMGAQHQAMEDMGPMAAPAWNMATAAMMVAMWWLMMIAMMSPGAAPTILLYARVHRHAAARQMPEDRLAPTGIFTAGYLLVWLLFSVMATALQWLLEREGLAAMTGSQSRWLSGGLLIATGLYQLSPLKRACLSHCRSPASFLSRHWRAGRAGALRLGALHGAYCVGCCWLLMALLFVAGVMNLLWIAILTLVVLIEKLLPRGEWAGRGIGVILIAWGAIILSSALGNGS